MVELGISNIKELQDFLAIYRPGPLAHFNDYKNNSPCKLSLAQDIAGETRGVLLYHDQCELVLQRMTGCTPEEAEFFRRDNCGVCRGKSFEALIQNISAFQNIPSEEAREQCIRWLAYIRYAAPRRKFQKAAFCIYRQAVEKLRELR